MSHSIVEFRGGFVRLHDVDLLCAIVLIADVLREADTAVPAELRNEVLSWGKRAVESGPGCIDLDLDAALVDDAAVQVLLVLLDGAEGRLSSLGDVVSSEFLASGLGVSRTAIGPISANLVAGALDQLQALLLTPSSGGVIR